MNKKIQLFIGLTCTLCSMLALANESSNKDFITAHQFTRLVKKKGASSIIMTLSKSPEDGQWDHVMTGIASGNDEWLDAVPLVWNTSSEGWNEDLESALGRAIPHNPRKVMALLEKTSRLDYMSVCAMPLYNASVPEQNDYVVKSIQGLYKVDTSMSKKCFDRLIDVVKKSPPFSEDVL